MMRERKEMDRPKNDNVNNINDNHNRNHKIIKIIFSKNTITLYNRYTIHKLKLKMEYSYMNVDA